jgi:hypothetical protein
MPLDIVLIAHAASTWLMVGLIWFVQLVHYPLFACISPDVRGVYHRSHQARTTWIVAPAMFVELGTGCLLVLSHLGLLMPRGDLGALPWIGLAGLGVVWASTFFVQVPLHARLTGSADYAATVRALVRTNWVRTFAWSVRGVIASMLLAV